MKHEQGKDGGGERVPFGWDAVSGGGEVDAAAVVASAEVGGRSSAGVGLPGLPLVYGRALHVRSVQLVEVPNA